jgi:hypothetical protein
MAGLGRLAPERLSAPRRVATIESIRSSTRIEGNKLSDRDVEKLLSNLEVKSFDTRDAQEVAGYAETTELIFQSRGRDHSDGQPRKAATPRPAQIQRKRRASSRRIQDPVQQRCSL